MRGDGIVAIGGTWRAAASQLLSHLITPEREIVTALEGVDATSAMTDELRAWLSENHPDVVVEVHRGGQPLYPYLFGVE